MNKTQSYHFIANLTANSWRSRRTGAGVSSPSSGVRPGARALNLELPTSFVVGALCLLLGSLLLSHSAYATFSASISRSGTVSLAEPGSSTIRPTSAGTLGTGSDTVSVTTNCTYGGYKLYVSATSTGGTALKLSDNSDSIPTSSNLVGSETTLSRDTWGVGKTASAFSGLQAYTDDIGKLTPFYTGVTSDSYTFYYGINVSTAKTPGTYTGEVLYTVLMDEACTKYTLNFDGNGATTNNLISQDLNFDSTIDLASISSSDKIARTGYTLTGWKDQSGNSYGITGTVDINPNDSASITLIAQWAPNTYTITYDANGGTGTTEEQKIIYDNGDITLRANNFTYSGYDFQGWSKTSRIDNTVDYNANTAYPINAIVSEAGVTDENNTTITLYAVWKKTIIYMQGWTGCSNLATGSTVTLVDKRDNSEYRVKKFVSKDNCLMIDNLVLGYDKGYALTPTDTNIVSGTYYIPKAGYQGSITSSSTVNSTAAVTFSTSSDNQGRVQYRAAGNEGDANNNGNYTLAQNTGYYNFYTATLGCSYYYDGLSSGQCASGYVARDICPKGWQLPTGNTDSKSWYQLYIEIQSHTKMISEADFFYSGLYNASDSLSYVGSYGYWWSSTVYATNTSRNLFLNSNDYVNYWDFSNKFYGFAVRCVVK